MNDRDYLPPVKLTARPDKLTLQVDRPTLSLEDIKSLEERMRRAASAKE